MKGRPWLLWTLVALPMLWLGGFGFAGMWQDWLGPQVRDHLDRRQAQADERKRRAAYERAGAGLVFELVTGAVAPGLPLDTLLHKFPPDRVHPYPTFARALYRDGPSVWVEVWARDGRLVQALRCHEPAGRPIDLRRDWFCDEFFPMSAADRAAHAAELAAWAAAARDARMAAAGVAATFEPYQWPSVR